MYIGMSLYAFQELDTAEQVAYIRQRIKDMIAEQLSSLRKDIGGHDEEKHCAKYNTEVKDIVDMEDEVFGPESYTPYELDDKGIDKCIDRMLMTGNSNSLFIDNYRATLSIYYTIYDKAKEIADWLCDEKTHGADSKFYKRELKQDMDGSFIGTGFLDQPKGSEIGKMFPEISVTEAKIILKKSPLISSCFFKVETAYPYLNSELSQNTGRYFDDVIKEKIQSLSPFKKAFWSLALSGYKMENNFNKDNQADYFSMDFSYKGQDYRIKFMHKTFDYNIPFIYVKNKEGSFEPANLHNIPQGAMDTIKKIKKAFDNSTIEPALIQNGKLICENIEIDGQGTPVPNNDELIA